MSEPILVIGGGGHARVVLDIIRCSGHCAAGILDDGLAPGTLVDGVPVLGPIDSFAAYTATHRFVIAIGSAFTRRRLAESLPVRWYTAIHPTAVIASTASIGEGTVVMAHAVVNAGASVGCHCILNTASITEHDNMLADYVHLSPRAALGGTVQVGEETHVGIGAVVRNNCTICSRCTIGAGAVVVSHIRESGVYVGIPARKQDSGPGQL